MVVILKQNLNNWFFYLYELFTLLIKYWNAILIIPPLLFNYFLGPHIWRWGLQEDLKDEI